MTPLHRLHVLSKLALSVSMGISILLAKRLPALLALALIGIGLTAASRPSRRALKMTLIPVLGLVNFVVLASLLLTHIEGTKVYVNRLVFRIEGERVVEWRIYVTDATLRYAASLALRVLAMAGSVIFLLATTSDRDLVWGLSSIGAPLSLCLVLSLLLRGLDLFVSDFFTVKEAIEARGFDFRRAGLPRKLTMYAYMIVPLIVLMLRRSYEVAIALESRGLSVSRGPRARYHKPKFGPGDILVAAAAAALPVIMLLAG